MLTYRICARHAGLTPESEARYENRMNRAGVTVVNQLEGHLDVVRGHLPRVYLIEVAAARHETWLLPLQLSRRPATRTASWHLGPVIHSMYPVRERRCLH